MNLTVEPALMNWLSAKNKDTVTIDVLVSRGGGCCGGCAFTETIINYGKPKGKTEKFLLFEQENLKVYVAGVLEKKTDHITLYLKGTLFKRIGLKGYDPDCSWRK